MMNFVIPAGIKVLQSKLQITSNRIVSTFNSAWCNDNGTLNNSTSYGSNTTDADFVLFMGAVNNPNESYLAYATFCVTGIFFF
jgi:hypothetical protein